MLQTPGHGGDIREGKDFLATTMAAHASDTVASQLVAAAPSLSALLRGRTASLHRHTEVLLGLPGAILTRDDYIIWLGRFLGLYEPLEQSLSAPAWEAQWEALGIALPARSHTRFLAADLAILGVDSACLPRTPREILPNLPTFAHALGGLYVLEGATLGGRLIMRDIEARIGPSIAGATSFFSGRGEAVDPMWQSFRVALDTFGGERPWLGDDVVYGARRVFRAILEWFEPCHTKTSDEP